MVKMPIDISAERLFFCFAFPCAQDKYLAKKIGFGDYQTLKRLVQVPGLSPDRELLARCFPRAYQRLLTFAQESRLEPWSLATMMEYWHNHHEGKDHCAVRLGTIKEIRLCHIKGRFDSILVDCVGEGIFVSNPFHFDLAVNDKVYVHWQMVTEKVETTESE